MTEDQWRKHRKFGMQTDFGWCSVIDGLVIIEGHAPLPVRMALKHKYNLPLRHWGAYELFLEANGIKARAGR